MQRVLITGAQGFVGRFLAAEWARQRPDDELLGLGRSPGQLTHFTHEVHWGTRRLPAPLPPDVSDTLERAQYRYVSLDLHDQNEFSRLLQEYRPHVVVHLAAALRGDPPQKLTQINIGTAVSLLEAISASGVEAPRTVLGSTGGIYGVPNTVPIDEDAPCNPIDPYSASKLAAEHFTRSLAHRHGIPALWARIFNIVGPGQDERHVCGRVAQQLSSMAVGLVEPRLELGTTSTTRDFVDVRDVATGLLLLADAGKPGQAYNLSSGRETQIEDVIRTTLELSGLEERVEIIRGIDRPANIPRHYGSISRMAALGYRPAHDLRSSLHDLYDYYANTVAGADRAESASKGHAFSVRVQASHRYDVVVGPQLLETVPARVRAMFPTARMALLTDDNVRPLHGERFLEGLLSEGLDVQLLTVPSGEQSKSLEQLQRLIGQLRELEIDRRGVLVCLGGGLVTDLGGFVASTYLRGVSYVNVPTTLIAQHDAAIGGKVAINMPWAKNFMGAFHHPRAVFVDPSLLRTLDDRNIGSGIAEAIKVAICGEPHLFQLLEQHVEAIREARSPEILAEVVGRAAEHKAALLAPDPYEVDLRRVLNLGHTFGHALETELAYRGILHGEAVAFGMALSTVIAQARALCAPDEAERILGLLHAYGLPPRVERKRLLECSAHLGALRLVRAQRLHLVIPTGTSSTTIVDDLREEELVAAVDTLSQHPLLGDRVIPGGTP